jgi:hypothetical protein
MAGFNVLVSNQKVRLKISYDATKRPVRCSSSLSGRTEKTFQPEDSHNHVGSVSCGACHRRFSMNAVLNYRSQSRFGSGRGQCKSACHRVSESEAQIFGRQPYASGDAKKKKGAWFQYYTSFSAILTAFITLRAD